MGLQVHDVGDATIPLQNGDVFTIEPGIYIPHENIGIRIEDDYWVSGQDVVCLSEALSKKPSDIEQLMKSDLSDKGSDNASQSEHSSFLENDFHMDEA